MRIVKGKIKIHTMLSVRCVSHHNALYSFSMLDLEDSRRLLTERMTEAEQEAFKIVEENIKLKDENKGS